MSSMMRCESPEVFASGDFWVYRRKERVNRAAFASKRILYNGYVDSLLEGYYNKFIILRGDFDGRIDT